MVINMKNKKVILSFTVAIVAIVSLFLAFNFIIKNKDRESKLISITVSELESKVNNKETFVLVISQTGCSHCEQYLPELERTLQEVNLNAYILNITGLSNEEASTLNKYANFSGTPTTIFFHDGEESTTLNRIVGYAAKTKIIEKLKSLGYID